MSNVELKPCEHCGGKAYIDCNDDIALVYCFKCGVRTKVYDNKKLAIEAWNTRVGRTCHNLHKTMNGFQCSECGEKYVFTVPNSHDWWSKYNATFCPNCGAKVVSVERINHI